MFLSGNIVSPFPQMQRPKENQFLCKQQHSAPMRQRISAQTQNSCEEEDRRGPSSTAPQNSETPVFTTNLISVLSFGKISSREKYYTSSLLFPVGYRSRRSYWSIYRIEWD